MRALKLMRSKYPLGTAAILSIFKRIEARAHILRYERVHGISPSSGDIFLVDGIDEPVLDGRVYINPPDVFKEDKFEAQIERSTEKPPIFRFVYSNRSRNYRLVHYLLCEKDSMRLEQKVPSKTASDHIEARFLASYSLIKDVLFPAEKPEAPIEELDMEYWGALVNKYLFE
ncbi:hypothetical protein NEFER03_1348 [Nematocida sp. LUAm3]|nr:hypothetical protein NEFER03_1348 [Nematocida sp. LUAm3]KAI5174030.1 hypothetical protein NEFER02_0497 [Nematocida sp. LUAm2]KAI5177227.1 hypothetical protein NEFER01_0502 [Nematocida sp. LUAm1]